MSVHATTRRNTIIDLQKMKTAGQRIPVTTAYDASFAALCEAAGVPVLIVGDSFGMVIQGHDSTLPVRLEDVAYHVAAVRRGCSRPLIVADMPFGTFQESKELAFRNAAQLMTAGAQMDLTLEGLVGADVKHVMLGVAAAGATEAFGPAGLFQGGLALRLCAELFKKSGQRQTRLKLDAIHCHGMSLLNGLATSMRLLLEKSRAR